jgi:hypothetical protein
MESQKTAIRWTVGDVSGPGFEALELSIRSARKLFGLGTKYVVCVNSIPLELVRERTGDVGREVEWVHSEHHVPAWLQSRLDAGMAEGVAWKLAPVRLFPDCYEISFDNDVILWRLPDAMKRWLESSDGESCLMAEDTQRSFGQFSDCCNGHAINSGIRGVPPGFALEERLQKKLRESQVVLRSELDEQGLQVAVLSQTALTLVSKEDVSICSPFPMHQQALGRCGAHFVGLNQRSLPWQLEGRGAHELIHERWRGFKPKLTELVDSIPGPNCSESISCNGHYPTVKGDS